MLVGLRSIFGKNKGGLLIKMKKNRVTMSVDKNFYKRIEDEKRKFMEKNKLNTLSTRAFTGILSNKDWIKKGR